MNELIDEQPKGPNVGLWSIDVMNEAFWTHIDRTADCYIFKRSVGSDCESEIGNFVDSSVTDENV